MARNFVEGSGQGPSDPQPEILPVNDAGSVQLPGNINAGDLELTRDGQNLVMTSPDGQVFVIEGYFLMPDAPVIIGANGALLTPSLVQSFVTSLGDIEVAAGPQVAVDLSPVGEVTEVSGNATVTHTDGTKEKITAGTQIFEGDIVETDAAGAVNIMFADESTFAVSQNARLAVDDFSFNPDDQSGSTGLSILRGVFMFTSGLVGRENPDAVSLETPVGSIGIRGTIIGGEINANGKSQISVIEGAIVVRNGAGEQILSQQFETVQLTGFNAPISNIGTLNAQGMTQSYGAVRSVSPTLFTSIDDTARDNNQQQQPTQQQQPASEAAPETNTPENQAPQTQNETAPQPVVVDQTVFQTLQTGSNLENPLGAAPAAPAAQAPAPAPVVVAPPAPASNTSAPVNTVPTQENLPPPTLVDTRPPANVVFGSNNAAIIVANEDAPAGTSIGVVQQTQSLPFAVTYSFASNPGNIFAINPTTGEITVAAGKHTGDVDIDPTTHHDLVVRVTRNDTGVFTDTSLTVNLTATNEAPEITTGAAIPINEDNSVTLDVSMINATDPEGDSITYAASHLLNGRIEVNGVIQNTFTHADLVGGDVVFIQTGAEPSEGASFKVTASDGSLSGTTKTINFSVTNVNDIPTDMALSANNIAENATTGTAVGTVTRTDADTSDTASYSLVNNPGGLFAIDANTGVISLVAGLSLNYETATSHTVRVRVTDGSSATYEEDFTINVTNVNETPTNIALSNSTIAENSSATTVVGTLSATDPDSGGSHTYELLDDAGGRFSLNGSGQIIVANAGLLNYEAATSHSIQVKVTDQGGLHYTKNLTITLSNMNEAPTDITLSANSVIENVVDNTVIGTAAGADPDSSQTFNYSLTNDAGGRFQINSVTGVLTVKDGDLLNHEANDSHEVTVRVTDQGGLTHDKSFTINVGDANDIPDSVTLNLTTASIPERESTGASAVVLGTIAVGDEDGNYDFANHDFEVQVWNQAANSGSGAWEDASGKFDVVPNAGSNGYDLLLKAGASLDYENNPSGLRLQVKVVDNGEVANAVISNEVTLTLQDADDTATEFHINKDAQFNGASQQLLLSGMSKNAILGFIHADDQDLNASFQLTSSNYRIVPGSVTGGVFTESDFSIINLNGRHALVLNNPEGYNFSGATSFGITVQMNANKDGDYADAADKSHTFTVIGRNDVMQLETLNGKNGFVIENNIRFGGAHFGASTAVGDLNGDGKADFVFGAPNALNGGGTEHTGGYYAGFNTGSFLAPTSGTFAYDTQFTAGGQMDGKVQLSSFLGAGAGYGQELADGNAGHQYGARIAFLKNFDGKSSAGGDIAVVDFNPDTNTGRVDIIRGLDNTVAMSITGIPIASGLTAEELSKAITVTSIGDINGDGLSDLLIGAQYAGTGASGQATIVFGSTTPSTMSWSTLTGSFLLAPETAPNAWFGASATNLGDINNDGYDDFAVSAPNVDTNAGSGGNHGNVHIYLGDDTATSASVLGTRHFTITGDPSTSVGGGERLTAAFAGDFNGDGMNDIMLRSNAADGMTGDIRVVWNNLGFTSGTNYNIAQMNDAGNLDGLLIRWAGGGSNVKVGDVFTSAGDFNGDGMGDVVIDVSRDIAGDGSLGFEHTLYVVYGGSSTSQFNLNLASSTSDMTRAYKIQLMEPTGAHLSVTGAGDINGDGYDDLLIGDSSETYGAGSAPDGEAYVVYGGNYNQATFTPVTGTTPVTIGSNGSVYAGDAADNTVSRSNANLNFSTGNLTTFNAGFGNDVLELKSTNTTASTVDLTNAIRSFDGGAGNDTIRLFFSQGDNSSSPIARTVNLTGVGQNVTGVENIAFKAGSYADILKLDIKDVLSMMQSSDTHTLTILAEEEAPNAGARNTLNIFEDGVAIGVGDLDLHGFTNDADGINGVIDKANLHGTQDAFVYTHLDTGFKLVIDSRLVNADAMV